MKRPAFQFYPADWRKDAGLQSCSIGSRGLWHELLCVMHECDPYGHLVVNGQPMADAQAARLCGVDLRDYRKLLTELDAAGVPSRTATGSIYSRRMVRDEAIRTVRAEAGKLGGNPALLGDKDNQKVKQKDKGKDNRNPTPSSSSSSSASTGVDLPEPSASAASPPANPSAIDAEKHGKNGGNGDWRKTDAGVIARGVALNKPPHPGEDREVYRDRVIKADYEARR